MDEQPSRWLGQVWKSCKTDVAPNGYMTKKETYMGDCQN